VRVLVVGGGGREHALAWKLAQSPTVDQVLAAPGNAGIEEVARCLPVDPTDPNSVATLADQESVDLTVIGAEAPLVAGVVDELERRGLWGFGPKQDAARIEGSKVWAKRLCDGNGIPTARSESFTDLVQAERYLDQVEPPYVVKADGLAAGKGVSVAETRDQAVAALRACLVDDVFGPAGREVLIEEHLQGIEVSALALTDGDTVLPLELAQDFKRVGQGDTGPNTGGMGAFSPATVADAETRSRIQDEVLVPTVRALAEEGIRYQGVLYAGLMLTGEGPKVLEFNCRFGDPEAQAVLPRLESNLAYALLACPEGNLSEQQPAWSPRACVTVVLASEGYPGDHAVGHPIEGLDDVRKFEDVLVFHAGTSRRDGRVVTAGGRVLAVTALGKDLAEARLRAYEAASLISFEGMHYRPDIAQEAAGG
jgi:phosphoribosylamine--glycine ligase